MELILFTASTRNSYVKLALFAVGVCSIQGYSNYTSTVCARATLSCFVPTKPAIVAIIFRVPSVKCQHSGKGCK